MNRELELGVTGENGEGPDKRGFHYLMDGSMGRGVIITAEIKGL